MCALVRGVLLQSAVRGVPPLDGADDDDDDGDDALMQRMIGTPEALIASTDI